MTASIHALMSAVMADVGSIGKNRQNKKQGYSFRGVDDVYNALQPALVKHGVFYAPEVVASRSEAYTSSGGTAMRLVSVDVKYRFYGPQGDSVEVGPILGEASDSGDKAASKALSMALKYALFEVFCIPTDESAENDPDGHSPEAPPPRSPDDPSDAQVRAAHAKYNALDDDGKRAFLAWSEQKGYGSPESLTKPQMRESLDKLTELGS